MTESWSSLERKLQIRKQKGIFDVPEFQEMAELKKINVCYQHLTYCTVEQGADIHNLKISKPALELETALAYRHNAVLEMLNLIL